MSIKFLDKINFAKRINQKFQGRRKFITNNDSSISAVVEGNIGMPDLNTKSEFVQNMIIDLLKECIDCGIDGFRFDAAKHIETPDDGSYASDFWPNVLNAANNYASSKGVTLYHYGEILNTPGSGRNWNSYTKYMSITDNVTGNNIRKAIVSKKFKLLSIQKDEFASRLCLSNEDGLVEEDEMSLEEINSLIKLYKSQIKKLGDEVKVIVKSASKINHTVDFIIKK